MPRPGLPRITLPQLWLAVAVLLPGLAALLTPLSTVDLAYGLRVGSELLDGRGIPTTDTYTYTVAGQPWLDQQWGAQVVLAAWWRALGWSGLLLLRSLLISLAWGALLVAMRRRAPGLGARTAAAMALTAFVVTSPAMALRPQLLGIVLFCLVLALLAGRHRHERQVLLVPILVVIWANVHGSFVLGPLLAGLAWLDDVRGGAGRTGASGRTARPSRAWRSPASAGRWSPIRDLARALPPAAALLNRSLVVAIASMLAMLVTPYGPGALAYALSLSSNRELASRITEWQPPSLGQADGILFFASLAVVALIAVARRDRLTRGGWLTLTVFAALGLIASRGDAWWPAAAAVTVAPLLAGDAIPSPFRRQPRATSANTALVLLLVLTALPLLRIGVPGDPSLGVGAPAGILGQAPAGVTATLRGVVGPGDRVWAPQTWGSWLELAVPAAPVAVDSRIELFPADLWADYDTVAGARPGWQAVLDRRGVTVLVVATAQAALLAAARGDAGWRELPSGDAAGSAGSAESAGSAGSVFVRADRAAA